MAPYKETKADDYTPADANDRPSLPALFPHPPEPDTELRRYRILSKSGSVRVSPLCLGAMSIGDQWKGFMGKTLNAQESFKFLDAFYDAGGNFIDTANNYQGMSRQQERLSADSRRAVRVHHRRVDAEARQP